MKVEHVVAHFKNARKNDKSDFAQNVHKPFQKYKEINNSDPDLVDFFNDINKLAKHFENLSPFTQRNYVQCISQSLDLDIIKDNVPDDVIANAKKTLKPILTETVKKSNQYQKQLDKKEAAQPDPTVDIADISVYNPSETENEPVNESVSDHDDAELVRLRVENAMLKNEVEWLRSLVMKVCTKENNIFH